MIKLINFKNIAPKIFASSIGLLLSSTVAYALSGDLVPGETLGQVPDIIVVIRAIIRFILIVAFVLAFIFLLIGGIRWITAGGDEKGVAGARGMITSALIGLVIVLVAYAIIRLVETFFGFDIITGGVTVPTIKD